MKIHKALVALFIIPALVVACSDQEPCEARPTTMAVQPDGTSQCMEADGEPCDDDPCDEESDGHKPKKSKTRRK